MFKVENNFSDFETDYAKEQVKQNPNEKVFRLLIGSPGTQVEVAFGVEDAQKLIESLTERLETFKG